VIKSYGIDFELIIHSKIKEIKNRKIDCIYIDLPLSDKNTPEYTTIMENAGFFFAGIIPELYDGDILRLQYLNNIDIVKDSIITVSDFCNELLNYVFTERLRVGNI
jgi:serine/threonine-protein kinase RsbW